MLVSDVMTVPAHSLPAGSRLEAVIQLLGTQRISCVPIVGDGGRVVGVVTEGDVLRVQLQADPRAHLRPVAAPALAWPSQVDEVMTPDPVTVEPHTDLAEVGRTLARTGWKSLPVTQDGVLVGVVSRSDIIRAMTTSDTAIRVRLVQDFAELGTDWEVDVVDGQVTVSGPVGAREVGLATVTATGVPGVRRVGIEPGHSDNPGAG